MGEKATLPPTPKGHELEGKNGQRERPEEEKKKNRGAGPKTWAVRWEIVPKEPRQNTRTAPSQSPIPKVLKKSVSGEDGHPYWRR